ncbi:hypothetical protein CLOM_g5050 [Closterium sp. NIES-68]|nr:hypothetical protein CLOM_g5050 [Closterium sp. NIES-68]
MAAASPAEWYNSLPPVSKAWGTALFATACAMQLKVLPVQLIFLDYTLIFQKFQIWRLVTSLLFAGGFSMRFVFTLLMVARYCVQMETSAFAGRTADFLYMLMVNTLSLLLIALILPFKIFFLSEPLLLSVLYLWSRENPNGVVNFMGLLSMPAFYLPWAYLFMDLLFGMSIVDPLAGIVAGHIYYFLTAVYPRTGGPQLIHTPLWVHRLVAQWAAVAPNMVQPQAPPRANQGAPPGGRGPAGGAAGGAAAAAGAGGGAVFRGRAYRLDRD